MSCAALILAAGASTRLGRPKQLVVFEDETLLERAIRIAKEAGCDPVVVVLGASEQLIRQQCKLRDVVVVSNPDWAEGMGTSISCGVREVGDVTGLVVIPCDMPAVNPAHLLALASTGEITASSYASQKGIPAYFPKAAFHRLLALSGETGAKELLRSASARELPGGELDVDTVEDVQRLEKTRPTS